MKSWVKFWLEIIGWYQLKGNEIRSINKEIVIKNYNSPKDILINLIYILYHNLNSFSASFYNYFTRC
jgi:hypothetical protein